MSFEIWAEKYRPKKFYELINQTHVVERVKAFVETKNLPHMLFSGAPGTGKTTLCLIIARELYGEEWKSNVLHLNASDDRGIDVIREQIKEFARTKAIGDVSFKLIILDESDAMTPDAQQALRRIMEMYASITRFILTANYQNKLIEPIQSRCVIFRFKPLEEKYVKEFIERIANNEKLQITQDGINAIVRICEGDLRRVANILQVAASISKKINEETIYEAAALAKPQEIKELISLAVSGNFLKAKEKLENMIIKEGLTGSDILNEIYRQITTLDISDTSKLLLLEKCGEIDFRISEGSNELIQLVSLLASIALHAKK